MVEIKGYCQPGFEGVREAFTKNFEEDGDVGASFAATVDGKFVVDIWAGYTDAAKTKPWQQDTIVNVYSTTKPMAAICTLMLYDRGLLDLDAPVAEYWPEFAQNGKDRIPVRYLLSHMSGLAGFERGVTVEDLYDWDGITAMLARQEPLWEPGTAAGYHILTYGFLLGEVLRRITGMSLGTFFAEEVAGPLGADFHIGLAAAEDYRVAELIPPPPLPPEAGPKYAADQPELRSRLFNPVFDPSVSMQRAWRAAEIPAANGHGNARAVARVASVIACGGTVDGVRLLGEDTVKKAAEVQISGTDLIIRMPIDYGLGFAIFTPGLLSWGGWGGSTFSANLDARVSQSYVMNMMREGITGDQRSLRLANALFASL